MERRACHRISVNVDIRFFCCSRVYTGTISNISKKGLLINTTEMCFPFDSQFEIFLPLKGEELRVPVSLSRILMLPDSHDSIGVELLNPSRDYLKFVNSLKAAV
jgi:hypothetical protein